MEKNDIIGKTFAEVKELYSNVRVCCIGTKQFILTMDYVPDRLNVTLSDEGLEYEDVRMKFDFMEEDLVDRQYKNYENAKVTSFHFG